MRALEQLALLPERLRPTKFVGGDGREGAGRRRAAAGTGARTNVDDMVIDGVAVAVVVARVLAILVG